MTEYLPDGAESVIVEENSEPWQVFTKVQFEGNSKVLYPGSYEKLKEIGLKSPVKSFRKAPVRYLFRLTHVNISAKCTISIDRIIKNSVQEEEFYAFLCCASSVIVKG